MSTFLISLLVVAAVTAAPDTLLTGGSKAGLGWGGGGEISQFEAGKVSWYYTWAPTSWVQPRPNIEYVPMLWGGKDVSAFAKAVTGASIASNGWTHILGMNEPQEPSQSNMSPADAANMWKTYLEPLKAGNPNLRLGSPAPSSRPNGIQWIFDFLGNCNGGCTVDFIALHYYDINATDFIRHINEYHDAFKRPIWVTEWACQNFNNGPQCSYNQIVRFLDETQTYMDKTDWVERYAWFGAMADTPINKDTRLMDSSGKINDLGKQYIGSKAPTTHGGAAQLRLPVCPFILSVMFVLLVVG
ncbi:glycoside hydrolase catalytic core protein [Rhizoctonia solani AG-3 Rhs1AP]|uniref:Glycoside hydrolase catalytic core protein n=2 Tax=Rhizoctonia solani AG-3 TaxID=1086053 RepID=A0A074SNG4_9AGAM|nr:glycoside hydrolase catalytic core protein [Rhizoctonia solani AG-3 Rhs1AP]KEP51587.1 glycoside hydrolase catalytic core protein [Rhizoctonia solani 123E]